MLVYIFHNLFCTYLVFYEKTVFANLRQFAIFSYKNHTANENIINVPIIIFILQFVIQKISE